MTTRPLIGVSASFLHADPARALFKGKTLLLAEESLLAWILSAGALPWLVPRAAGAVDAGDLVDALDGLVLTGGADMAPGSYGETPLRPEWAGDAARDAYEIDLVRRCAARDRPVLGVCRGIQALNVALGGTLHQDVATQHPGHAVHRVWEVYDRHGHDIAIEPGSRLAAWYRGRYLDVRARVNSVHHQGLKDLAPGTEVEARSPDGLVEAACFHAGGVSGEAFLYGVQWHPEFVHARTERDRGGDQTVALDAGVLLGAFLAEVESRRLARRVRRGHRVRRARSLRNNGGTR